MRVIVTGGSGFIGTHLVRRLRGLGYSPVVVDQALRCEMAAEMHRCSVLDAEAMHEVIRDAQAVIHLAGPVRDGIRRDPYWGSMLQLQGTLNVLEACRLNEIPHLLLASSFYVYHNLPEDVTAVEETLSDPLRMDLFGSVKLMSEALCREYTRKYGIAHSVLRLGSAYGPGGSNVIRTFVETGLRGDVLQVWGAGKRRNQYTFVEDLANGIAAALDTRNETFNLCSPEVTTTGCLGAILKSEFGFAVHFDPTRPEEPSLPFVDSRKAAERLGWKPLSLLDGLHLTVEEVRGKMATAYTRPA